MHVVRVFPVRLLGFGLYWAWLFLVTLSSSPVLGPMELGGLPSELIELVFRLAFVVAIFFAGDRISSPRGRALLLVACCIGGPISTLLMAATHGTQLGVAALALLGLADAATFVLWLCFFGHMRVGETALYMVLSYCLGGMLCLVIPAVSGEWVTLVSALLLAASGGMFYLSNKFYSNETGVAELFSSADDARDHHEGAQEQYAYLKRLRIALGSTALLFGCASGSLYFGLSDSFLPASLVESACCIVLAVVCGTMILVTRQSQDLCVLYKLSPVILVAGVFLMLGDGMAVETLGAALVNLGYLIFEITALNDYCIAAKSRSLSLVRTFSMARIAITVGLVIGWAFAVAVNALGVPSPLLFMLGISLTSVVFSATVVFTDKQIAKARTVASIQERIESTEVAESRKASRFPDDVKRFAVAHQLTSRETEIAELVLRGRNAAYIADQLRLAPGTVKTHTHNMYAKVGVHSRMEFLDAFEAMR